MLFGVSVGEHEKLGVAVEGYVGEEFVTNRLDVLGHGLGLDFRERRLSGVCLGAGVAA